MSAAAVLPLSRAPLPALWLCRDVVEQVLERLVDDKSSLGTSEKLQVHPLRAVITAILGSCRG